MSTFLRRLDTLRFVVAHPVAAACAMWSLYRDSPGLVLHLPLPPPEVCRGPGDHVVPEA